MFQFGQNSFKFQDKNFCGVVDVRGEIMFVDCQDGL